MSQHNSRKEPTFGEPIAKQTEIDFTEPTQAASEPKISVSLHSTQSPGYTFTPVLKRSGEVADELPSFEEQAAEARTESASQTPEAAKTVSELKFTSVSKQEPLSSEKTANIAEPTAVGRTPNAVHTEDLQARVIPTTTAKPRLGDKVPPKYRRLLMVIALALVLLLVFFWLKPSTPETVAQLQQQGTSLPIEFRPVNEEEAKRAEAEAKALQEAQQKAAEAAAQQVQQPTAPLVQPQTVEQPVVQPLPPATSTIASSETPPPAPPKPESEPTVIAAPKPSVIHQPEERTEPVKKVEKTEQPKAVAPSPKPKTNEDQLDKLIQAVDKKATPASSASTKVLTVPKGVSLMQVFRDNQLNIADVNAMSKVNNVVSNLKVGEKVTVKLDKNNRVVEMSIGSGGKFIRQENGSYQFK